MSIRNLFGRHFNGSDLNYNPDDLGSSWSEGAKLLLSICLIPLWYKLTVFMREFLINRYRGVAYTHGFISFPKWMSLTWNIFGVVSCVVIFFTILFLNNSNFTEVSIKTIRNLLFTLFLSAIFAYMCVK